MQIDALIRSICLRERHYMFFLGAGASITSGVPSAWECIWNWKRSLFLTQNSHINPTLFGSATLPHVQRQIQKWLDRQMIHPPLDSQEEYSHYVESCFQFAKDRQEEFRRMAKKATPHVGYQLLGLLMETGKVKWIWTTNFDDLVERGRPSNRQRPFLQIGMDSTQRIDNLQRDSDDAIQIFLHGDYRYDSLKNTDEELQMLDAKCLEKFVELTKELPLIVLGYSGRDKSIIDALTKAYSTRVNGGLFWCCMDKSEPAEIVAKLIVKAKEVGNTAEIVSYNGLDDFLIRLSRYWLKDLPEHTRVENLLSTLPVNKGFDIDNLSPDFDWIIGNAYPIELPGEMFQFYINSLPEKGAWKKLRDISDNHPITVGLFKGKVLALGRLADINATFKSHLASKIEQISLHSDELTISNSIVYEILLKGLVDSLESRGFKRVGKYQLAALQEKMHDYKGNKYNYSETIELSLDCASGKTYLLLLPGVKLSNEGLPEDEVKSIKRDILWRQRNREYRTTIKDWENKLFPKKEARRIVFPPKAETGIEFKISPDSPVCTRLFSARPKAVNSELVSQFNRFEKFKAFRVDEPYLLFRGSLDAKYPSKSIHPITGLIDCGGPFEKYDSTIHSSKNIRLGVICAAGHEGLLRAFLNQLNERATVGRYDDADYLVDFPGFGEAFKCELSVPSSNNDPEWKTISALPEGEPISMCQKTIQLVAEKLKELETSTSIDVVIIYIPKSWATFEKVVTNDIHLDLHDQIKAICVERGIRSQLIRESKVRNENTCRMRWWLSLALFTKAMRTPWMLESSGEKVAYVGIGYSIDEASKDDHIVLGCSHVFDSTGQGLRFRLSQLQKPIWRENPFTRQKNPFMSRDDAYLLGDRTRQLFYEAHQSLPNRVMICKRTPFLNTEVEGLLSALSGIPHVDLLTIQQDRIWRFCAYDTVKKEVHGFPVKRGTGLILDDADMLLWLHGNVINLKNNRSYFQGKSRIPTPVRVTRYAGDTPVETIAGELLALTKMDWNTFALYKQMPVTVTTPNSIARIGRLLHRLAADSYDYRLFM